MMASDAGECSVLVLLDLSSAFDTVDHGIMIDRLRQWVRISGSALDWFSSYLSVQSFSVSVDPYSSASAALSCGVPQGSILGPVLFALYMLLLGIIINKFKGISYHCYVDDIQLYISFKPDNTDKLSVLHDCLSAINGQITFYSLMQRKLRLLLLQQTVSDLISLNVLGPCLLLFGATLGIFVLFLTSLCYLTTMLSCFPALVFITSEIVPN